MQERVAAVLHGCPDNQKDTLRKSHKIRPSTKRKFTQRRHWSCKISSNQNRLLGELSYQESQNTDVISRLMPVQWIESQTGKEGLVNCDCNNGNGINSAQLARAHNVELVAKCGKKLKTSQFSSQCTLHRTSHYLPPFSPLDPGKGSVQILNC